MGGDKGEACDIFIRWKNVLTYFSRVVLFHITGFYQWSENSRDWVFWWLIKSSVNYVPWKLHIEISRIVLFKKLRRSIFKTSEVLYLRRYNQIFMITRFLETKPKTRRYNAMYLRVFKSKSNVCGCSTWQTASGYFKAFGFSVTFAAQMFVNQQTSPYGSKLPTDLSADCQPLLET